MIKGPNYLFIENPKTGTSSIREYLRKHCKGEEIGGYRRHQYLTGPHENFTFVGWRNPMDRLFSAYKQQLPSYKGMSFSDWLLNIENRYGHVIQTTPQLLYASYVDAFIYFEFGIEHQLRKIMEHLGYELKGTKLEHRNETARTQYPPDWDVACEIAKKRRLLVDINRVVH